MSFFFFLFLSLITAVSFEGNSTWSRSGSAFDAKTNTDPLLKWPFYRIKVRRLTFSFYYYFDCRVINFKGHELLKTQVYMFVELLAHFNATLRCRGWSFFYFITLRDKAYSYTLFLINNN